MLIGRGTHKKGEVGVSGRPQISWLSEGLAITQDFHTSGSLVREAFKNVLADFVKKPLADRGGTPPP